MIIMKAFTFNREKSGPWREIDILAKIGLTAPHIKVFNSLF